MLNQTLRRDRNHVCRHSFRSLGTAQTLKRIKMARKGEVVRFKRFTRRLNLSFMIHADFKSILI